MKGDSGTRRARQSVAAAIVADHQEPAPLEIRVRCAGALRALHAQGRLRSMWIPGMRGTDPDGHSAVCSCAAEALMWFAEKPRRAPDPRDPSTQGALVRFLGEVGARVGLTVDPEERGSDPTALLVTGTVRQAWQGELHEVLVEALEDEVRQNRRGEV